MLLLYACGESTTDDLARMEAERDALVLACDGKSASFDACRLACKEVRDEAERKDCTFKLAERAPRWASGDARHALQIAYNLCPQTGALHEACLEHSLHEVAITCTPAGAPWVDDVHFDGGPMWRTWRGCVAKNVLGRLKKKCLPALRDEYHNAWKNDDRGLCGL